MKETNKKDQKIKDMEMSKREMLWKFLGEKKCLGVDVTAVEISKTVGKYTACLETFIGKVNGNMHCGSMIYIYTLSFLSPLPCMFKRMKPRMDMSFS